MQNYIAAPQSSSEQGRSVGTIIKESPAPGWPAQAQTNFFFKIYLDFFRNSCWIQRMLLPLAFFFDKYFSFSIHMKSRKKYETTEFPEKYSCALQRGFLF